MLAEIRRTPLLNIRDIVSNINLIFKFVVVRFRMVQDKVNEDLEFTIYRAVTNCKLLISRKIFVNSQELKNLVIK